MTHHEGRNSRKHEVPPAQSLPLHLHKISKRSLAHRRKDQQSIRQGMNPPAHELVVKVRGITNGVSSITLVRIDLMAREIVLQTIWTKGLVDGDFALSHTDHGQDVVLSLAQLAAAAASPGIKGMPACIVQLRVRWRRLIQGICDCFSWSWLAWRVKCGRPVASSGSCESA